MPRRPTLSSDTAPSLSTALASGRRITEQTNSGGTSTFVPVPNAPVGVMQGDAGSGGRPGLVPEPVAGDAAKYLKGDGTWAAPTASASATTVEIDLGSEQVFRGKFTITDAAITGTSKVLCWQAPGPYTGKGSLADAAEMEPVQVIAVEPGTGSAVVRWQTPPMLVSVEQRGNGRRDVANLSVHQPQSVVKRVGTVRGNVKFSYMVMA